MKNNMNNIPEEEVLHGSAMTNAQYSDKLCRFIAAEIDRFNKENKNSESKFHGATVIVAVGDDEGVSTSGFTHTLDSISKEEADKTDFAMKDAFKSMTQS